MSILLGAPNLTFVLIGLILIVYLVVQFIVSKVFVLPGPLLLLVGWFTTCIVVFGGLFLWKLVDKIKERRGK